MTDFLILKPRLQQIVMLELVIPLWVSTMETFNVGKAVRNFLEDFYPVIYQAEGRMI